MRLAGKLPIPRQATLANLRDPRSGDLLDRALVLWMPGPATATGEDVAELHLHGGRAVVDAVQSSLAGLAELRPARPGEFTRRAFDNGRIDLNEAEGLADLLAAETQSQRKAALAAAGGMLSRRVEDWRERLLEASAMIEAAIDYAEEDDVSSNSEAVRPALAAMHMEIRDLLSRPPAERLRDGIRVAVAGPPNAGKSSLVNALAQRDAAITSPHAGTTRDLIEVPVVLGGMPFVLIDTAGLRVAGDEIEAIGVQRAEQTMQAADILLWLGDDEGPTAANKLSICSRADKRLCPQDRLPVSARTGLNLTKLVELLVEQAGSLLPSEGEIAINRRQRGVLAQVADCLDQVVEQSDDLLLAENIRICLVLCDELTGRAGVEDMLDALFARFCLGK